LADAEEEDRIEVAEVADVELLAGRDARASRKHDRPLRDQLRIGSDERVERARLTAEPFQGGDGVGDRVVLVAVPDVGPRQHAACGWMWLSGRRNNSGRAQYGGREQFGIWNVEFGIRTRSRSIQVTHSKIPNSKFLIAERESDYLRSRRCAEEAAAARGDGDILPSVLAEKGHRRGVRA